MYPYIHSPVHLHGIVGRDSTAQGQLPLPSYNTSDLYVELLIVYLDIIPSNR
jgi:hypothetical protein